MTSSINKVKNTLLFLTQTLDELKFNIKPILEESFKYTNENLYIYINPLINKSSQQASIQSSNTIDPQPITDRFKLKSILSTFYQKSFKLNPKVNVTCLLNNVHAASKMNKASKNFKYDAILTDISIKSPVFSKLNQFCDFNLPNEQILDTSSIPIYSIFQENSASNNIEPISNDSSLHIDDQLYANKVYQNAIMGGTFDRLHIGHKIMLSEAVLLTKNRLLIGITNECMLKRKKLSELIEPFDTRCKNVKHFLDMVASDLEFIPFNITDPYGPSIIEKDYQCLIVSQETFKTGKMVNEKRLENKLPELEIHVVELVKDNDIADGDEDKVSSSNFRRHLLGTLLKKPYVSYDPSKPYVIGLTGGLASGKSNIRNDLEKLGAGTIDCDKLGHLTYEKDTRAYKEIISTFSEDILGDSGEIDRKKLGGKVFNNKAELKKLTDIVWPEIGYLMNEQIKVLFNKGHKIIVVEAALLIDANWHANLNEVWVSFVPDETAIERSMARDGSNIEKVKGILSSQMSNQQRISHANVVFSSLWQREYTISQVQKAWELLVERTISSKL